MMTLLTRTELVQQIICCEQNNYKKRSIKNHYVVYLSLLPDPVSSCLSLQVILGVPV